MQYNFAKVNMTHGVRKWKMWPVIMLIICIRDTLLYHIMSMQMDKSPREKSTRERNTKHFKVLSFFLPKRLNLNL